MDSFSFMIIDQSNIVSVYESIPFKASYHDFKYIDPVEILSIIQSNNLRSNKFENVKISLDHDSFTYVPEEVYEADAWVNYLSFVSSGVKKDDVVSSKIDDGRVCVYTYPLSVRKLFSTLYPNGRIAHLSESLVKFLGVEVFDEPTLFVVIRDQEVYIIVFEDQGITLVNRYHAPTGKDRLYYVLLACKHRKLNPRKLNIKVTGSPGAKDLQSDLRQFFVLVSLIDWKNGWRLPLSVKNPMDLFEFYCMHHENHRRAV